MAPSQEVLFQYKDLVLNVFCHLGLMVKLAKLDLVAAKQFTFLGLCWDMARASITNGQSQEDLLSHVSHLAGLAEVFNADQLCLCHSTGVVMHTCSANQSVLNLLFHFELFQVVHCRRGGYAGAPLVSKPLCSHFPM